MDLFHLGLDRVDELFATRNGLEASLEPVGELFDLGEPCLDA